MSHCPLRYLAYVCAQWWSVRPLFYGVRLLRKLVGEENLRCDAVNALNLKPGERVLNMCSGLGDNLRLLVGHEVELFGADPNRDYAEAGRLEIRDNEWHNIRVIHWTDGRLPFPKESFDAIFITYGMTGTSNPGNIIAECERLLKPNGRIVVVDWITPSKGNTIFSGIIWPLYLLMGCNPYTPWRRQFSRAFEVSSHREFYSGLMTLICGIKTKALAKSPQSDVSSELDNSPAQRESIEESTVSSQPTTVQETTFQNTTEGANKAPETDKTEKIADKS